MALQPHGPDQRRVYGRGFYDGKRQALESMNNARLLSIEQGLNGSARKVLDATPASEPWTLAAICTEIRRQGHNLDKATVQGCLGKMVSQGVVREPQPGVFIRLNPKPALQAVPQQAPESAPDAPAPTPPPATAAHESGDDERGIKRLIDIVAGVRDLSDCAARLASEIEDAALDMEARLEQLQTDTVKLRQLQTLLKSIGQG